MNRKVLIIPMVCLLMSAPFISVIYSKTATEICKEQRPAVVLIMVADKAGNFKGQGSGFVAKSNGVVITNYHVIAGASKAQIKLPNGDIYDIAGVVEGDARRDIAVLKVKAINLPTVKLGDSDKTQVGDPVVVIGSPLGLENTVSNGLISSLRDTGEGYKLFQISAPISRGSSGGPVFNMNGEVIGIASLTISTGQSLNFAIPINYVIPLISDKITSAGSE